MIFFSAAATEESGELIIRLPAPATTLRQDIVRHLLYGRFIIYAVLFYFLYLAITAEIVLFAIFTAVSIWMTFEDLYENYAYKKLYRHHPEIRMTTSTRTIRWGAETCSFDDVRDVHYEAWQKSIDENRSEIGGYHLLIRTSNKKKLLIATTDEPETTSIDHLASIVSTWLSKPLTIRKY